MKRFDIRADTWDGLRLESLTKSESGKEIEKFEPPFRPYCYVEATDDKSRFSEIWDYCEDNDIEIIQDCDRPGHWKLEADDPYTIRTTKWDADFETKEADIRYPRRVMIDEGLEVDIPEPEDILYFDIEVDPRGEFPDAEEAAKQVISIAAVDGNGNEFFFCDDDEETVLRQFFDLLDEYYVIAGWNSETFDWPYLKNRLQIMPFDYDDFEVVHLDLQYLFMHINREERQSFALDAVGQDEVGMGKTMNEEDHEMGYDVLWHWFQNDRETLEEYNVEDCRICAAIDEKYRLTRIVFRICRRGKVRPSQLMYRTEEGQVNMGVGKACDSVILSAGQRRDYTFPNNGKYADLHDFPGGRVIEPKPGVYDDVITVDFSGMYPAIIRDFNIGPNSWIDCDNVEDALEVANEHYDDFPIDEDDLIWGVGPHDEAESNKARGFFLRPDIDQSVIAEAIDDLEDLRKEFKEKKKQAQKGTDEWHKFNNIDRGLKVLVNSMYGVGASPYKRYYVPGMSENITEIGQHLILQCKLHAESVLEDVEQVIYGDTDSIMIELEPDGEDVVEVAKRVANKMNEFIVEYVREEHNSPGNYMKLDLDDVYKSYLITDKKKNYSGIVIYDEGPCADWKIKGFPCVKANTATAAANFQKKLIWALLNGNPTRPIIDEFKDKLFKGEFDQQMVQHTRLNKMPDEYETLMAHARAARMIIEREGDRGAVRTGDKIQYLKYGDNTTDVMPTDDGIKDFRPNERYDPDRDEVVRDEENGEGQSPLLRDSHYSYLWTKRFKSKMDQVGVEEYKQQSLATFATA